MSYLFDREILVLDGAMGTQLMQKGLQAGHPSILWNVTHAADVIAVHTAYRDAGSHCLITNSFGGSRLMLQRHGLEDRMVDLNVAAVQNAKEAASGRCMVLGDIGPCGDFLDPLGDITEEQLYQDVKLQASIMKDAGVNGFIVETMADPGEMMVSVSAAKEFGLPVLASFTFEVSPRGFQTMMGTLPGIAAKAAIEAGADAVGANCGTSLDLNAYLEIGSLMKEKSGYHQVLLQPNAGAPIQDGDGYRYDMDPSQFAKWARLARAEGVTIFGGCCGTTPIHLAALAGNFAR